MIDNGSAHHDVPAPARTHHTPAPIVSAVPVVAPAVPPHADAIVTVGGREPPDAESVVQISIGRVEVRATLASAEPPRRAERAPREDPLPLHDYLRGRTVSGR